MAPEAVVFDIGNVLMNWDPEGFYDRAIGRVARTRMFHEVPLHEMNAQIDAGAPWHATVEETARAHRRWSRDILSWRDQWGEMASPLIEESVAILRTLREQGVPVFALTNFGRETFAEARRIHPALTEFDGAVVSGHVGMVKPDPGIYEVLERKSGIAPEALFFTDDRPENIEAAAARGWRTHLFEGAQGLRRRLAEEGLLPPEQARVPLTEERPEGVAPAPAPKRPVEDRPAEASEAGARRPLAEERPAEAEDGAEGSAAGRRPLTEEKPAKEVQPAPETEPKTDRDAE